jgi:Cof subfamily protein (haloacid dehalogenase superfamily)
MNEIKMIVTDLDGTLLRKDKTVSGYTSSVFRRCRDMGIKTVFATARPVRTVKSLNLSVRNDAAIYHNGAVITIDDVVYRRFGIGAETANSLLSHIINRYKGLRSSIEIDDVLYANFDVSSVWSNTGAVWTDFSDLPDRPADKIIFVTAESQMVSGIRGMLPDELYGEIVENQILTVMHKEAGKRNAVGEIAERFGISLSSVAAFGDDYNDMEMLRACGTGLAMGNALAEVKAAADDICDTNDNDGVAKWLERNI